MKWFLLIPISLSALTKDELQDKGWENCKIGLKDTGIGLVKLGLAAKTLLSGDVYSSLYLQAEAGVNFSDALTSFIESVGNYRDAAKWREDRELPSHD